MEKLSLARETAHLDWSHFQPREGLYCIPAIAAVLFSGVMLGEPAAGMIMAGAALNIGFGSFRKIQGSRLAAMLLAVVGTSFSAFAGTVLGYSDTSEAIAACLWGFVYGLLVVFGDDISWIGLQCGIALLVAGAFPGSLENGVIRGGLVLAGGVVQVGLFAMLWHLFSGAPLREDVAQVDPHKALQAIRGELNLRDPLTKLNSTAAQYALRVAATLALAVLTYRLLHLQNGYWLPLTTLLVLKPDFYRTYVGGLTRVLGTLAGVTVATLLTLLLRPQPLVLIALVLLFSWLAYAFQKVNYALFTGWITSFIVFLVAIAGLPEAVVTVHRLLDTALGSGIALISRVIGHTWTVAQQKHALEKVATAVGQGSG